MARNTSSQNGRGRLNAKKESKIEKRISMETVPEEGVSDETKAVSRPLGHGTRSLKPEEANSALVELSEILIFVQDPANICTFVTCILATVVLACINEDRYYLALSMLMACNITDLLDGQLARATLDRHPAINTFGRIIDLVTEVSNVVAPPLLLVKLSNFSLIPVCAGTLYFAAGNIRMAQHLAVGTRYHGGKCGSYLYLGLWGEYNLCAIAVLGHLMPLVGRDAFINILSVVILLLTGGMMMTGLRSNKYNRMDMFWLILFSACLCVTLFIMELRASHPNREIQLVSLETVSFVSYSLMLYPCLFKHIKWWSGKTKPKQK